MENKYETFSIRENIGKIFPWKENPNLVLVITPRLAHRLNHSATESFDVIKHCFQPITLQNIIAILDCSVKETEIQKDRYVRKEDFESQLM